MSEEWKEGSDDFGHELLKKTLGIVVFKLCKDFRMNKYHGEIRIHGVVIQTGTYQGPIEKAKEEIYSNAVQLFERALHDLKNQHV